MTKWPTFDQSANIDKLQKSENFWSKCEQRRTAKILRNYRRLIKVRTLTNSKNLKTFDQSANRDELQKAYVMTNFWSKCEQRRTPKKKSYDFLFCVVKHDEMTNVWSKCEHRPTAKSYVITDVWSKCEHKLTTKIWKLLIKVRTETACAPSADDPCPWLLSTRLVLIWCR